MAVPVGAFASYEQQWLAANPENILVGIFLAPDQRRRASAFGCLAHELVQAAFRVREPQVATAKLNWWAQELTEAAAGRARHPVTQTLFSELFVRGLDHMLWSDLIDGALTQLDHPAAADMAGLFAQFAPFHAAITRVERALFLYSDANIAANETLWTITHLLQELPNLQHTDERLYLPLDLLARHGLTHADLPNTTPARAALLKDYLAALLNESNRALAVMSVRALPRRVRSRLDRILAAAAIKANDPLAYLAIHARAGYWRSLWITWSEARAMPRTS